MRFKGEEYLMGEDLITNTWTFHHEPCGKILGTPSCLLTAMAIATEHSSKCLEAAA